MERYKVILSYEGTAFKGMQRQALERTVQGEVESALRSIGWEGQAIQFAGRTDAGVHASGQVIAFGMNWNHSVAKLLNALNASLAHDLAATELAVVGGDFHPRYDAVARHYRYSIYCQPQRDPLRERYAWRLWPKLNLRSLNETSRPFVGEHDFAAFGTPQKAGGPTVRKVLKAEWRHESEDELTFTIVANAFLYHMVRRVVGLLVKVDQGFAEKDRVLAALRKPTALEQELAPAHGLKLMRVDY